MDVSPAGALVQAPSEFRKSLFGTDRVYFHAAVIKIAHVAAEPEFSGYSLHKIAESDSLNPTAYPPAAGGF